MFSFHAKALDSVKFLKPGEIGLSKMNVVVERLKDVEFVAEQILSDKQAIVNYDKQRQKSREAFK